MPNRRAEYATEPDEHGSIPAGPAHHGFTIMVGISPYAHEPDEDDLGREDTHEAFEYDDGDRELHLPRFRNKQEIRRHVECLKTEISYYEAVLNGDDRAASKARELLFNSMGNDGDEDSDNE